MSYEGPKDNEFKHVMPKRNMPGLIRSRISEANNSYLYPSVEEGKELNVDLSKFPKEFFEGTMTLMDKIDLVLKNKDISFNSLANELNICEDKLKSYIKKEKLPKSVLKELSLYSGYPIEFFKLKSLQSLVK